MDGWLTLLAEWQIHKLSTTCIFENEVKQYIRTIRHWALKAWKPPIYLLRLECSFVIRYLILLLIVCLWRLCLYFLFSEYVLLKTSLWLACFFFRSFFCHWNLCLLHILLYLKIFCVHNTVYIFFFCMEMTLSLVFQLLKQNVHHCNATYTIVCAEVKGQKNFTTCAWTKTLGRRGRVT